MHVLITSPTFPPQGGGVAEVARRQQRFLKERGHTVEVFSSTVDAPELEPAGVTRFAVRPGSFPAYAAGDRWGVRAPEAKECYLDAVRRSSAQVVLSHCWQAWNTDWLFEEPDGFGKPVVLFSHGTSVNSLSGVLGPLRFLRWREYAWRTIPRTLQRAAGVVLLEEHADDDRFLDARIARRLGIAAHVVPNGCAPELLASPSTAVGSKEPVVLCVAQYTPEKNPEAVVEAFAALNPPGATLVVCGATATPYLAALRRRVDSLAPSLAGRITLEVGPSRERLLQLYRQASIVVSASLTECQPLVLIDAMGAGVPFISTRVGCVQALPGGWVVDDDEALRAALARLLMDVALRHSLGAAGREAATTKYNWNSSLLSLERGLLGILGHEKSTSGVCA